MSAQHGPGILVATDEGLYLVAAAGAVRVDELAGRAVPALAVARGRRWAIADGKELWESAGDARWSLVATVPRPKATCLGATPEGLLICTAGAHLLRLDGDRLRPGRSFDQVEVLASGPKPWGSPPPPRPTSAT